MNILFLTNNPPVTDPLLRWLRRKEGVVVSWSEPLSPDLFREGGELHGVEFVVSYNYAHLVGPGVLALFPGRIINLHISLLPWNRGASPNVFAFLDGAPTGVTIHEMDERIDTGGILLQEEIRFDYEAETLCSSYQKSHALIRELFCSNWEELKRGRIPARPQADGTFHTAKDLERRCGAIDYDDSIAEFLRKQKEPG